MAANAPEMSLVLGTVGRVRELSAFLDALRFQPRDRVELIVVDQNHDDRVADLLKRRDDGLPLQHVRVPWRGVSRARNLGASLASAPVLGFPDDDCSYPPGLLAGVLDWLERHPAADGLSCRVSDRDGRRSAGGYMSHRSHWLRRRNVWRSAVSPGIFVRRRLHEDLAGFDERLGAGAGTPWGSAEDTDYLLRALCDGASLYYDAERIVHHPPTIDRGPLLRRSFGYGRGMGFVLRRHGFGPHTAVAFAALSWGAAAWNVARLEPRPAAARVAMGLGRLTGWIQARDEAAEMPVPAAIPDRALRTSPS